MSIRLAHLAPVVLLFSFAFAKDRDKKSSLPDFVLQAHSVRVVVSPGGQPLDQSPTANSNAVEQVATAVKAWGRYELVYEGESDLVIAVRAGTGRLMSPAIKIGPTDNRPDVAQPSGGSVRIGGQQGMDSPGAGPRVATEYGRGDDLMEVYQGGLAYRRGQPPVWWYSAKDALKAPAVPAVEKFRKAVETAEQKKKP